MRITREMIDQRVDHLNRITGNALKPYRKDASGNTIANVGTYSRHGGHGGHTIERIDNERGGCTDLFNMGYMPARQCYDMLGAYIKGYEARMVR